MGFLGCCLPGWRCRRRLPHQRRHAVPRMLTDMPRLCYWSINKFFLLNLAWGGPEPCRFPGRDNIALSFGSRGPYLTFAIYSEQTETETDQEARWRYAIYDPFASVDFRLPSMIRDGKGDRRPAVGINRFQLSCEPPECTVVAWTCGFYDNHEPRILLCRPGDRDWVEGPIVHTLGFDMIFFQGQLYCVDQETEWIRAYDVLQHDVLDHDHKYDLSSLPRRDVLCCNMRLDGYGWPEYYLVESGGELLAVTRYNTRKYDVRHNKIAFTVHRVDLENRQLVRVDDLGDRMLFIGRGCSQSWSGQAEPVTPFYTKNCIYFLDYGCLRYPDTDHVFYSIGKFRLSREEVGTSFAELSSAHAFQSMPAGWVRSPTSSS